VFHLRLKLIALAVLAAMTIVMLRLGQMQLLNADHYRDEGHKRRIRTTFPDAARGAILARDGTVLAEDRPVLSICVALREVDPCSPPPGLTSDLDVSLEFDKNDRPPMTAEEYEAWCETCAALVGDTVGDFKKRVDAARKRIEDEINQRKREIYAAGSSEDEALRKRARTEEVILRKIRTSRGSPQVLYNDVPFAVIARVEAVISDVPGLVVTESLKRKYREKPLAAHAVGYMNKASQREYELYHYDYLGDEAKRLTIHDMMGRGGLEELFNFELRGARGRREEVIDARGLVQEILDEELPVQGCSILTTIDPNIQAAAEKALAKAFKETDCPGAAVCLDVHTGDVLAMASFPAFDPNTINKDFADLLSEEGMGRYRPLLNRAIKGQYPLGSVFKVVTATAALESGAITTTTTFHCSGSMKVGRRAYHCLGRHGDLNVLDALKRSCNVFFFSAGRAAGGPALTEWALRFGLGRATGIDLPGESTGNVPTAPSTGDVLNLSIGQGRLIVTPLQVARLMAAVANGGELVTPRLQLTAPPGPTRPVGFSEKTLEVLRAGLFKVVNERGGTGYSRVRSDKIVIAGKTGTAQAGSKGDHAWFGGFAPYHEPRVSFAVVIEYGGHGGAVAGPVAQAMAEVWAEEHGLP
jgi:penicillin-binding protein 2